MTDLVIVGEAWGREEEAAGRPFVGASGRLLRLLLRSVGIDPDSAYITNVFNFRPRPTNDVKNLCGPKTLGLPGWPALSVGKYVRATFAAELDRLHKEIANEKPNLVLALGATPTWALLHRTPRISQLRGAPVWSAQHNVKVLPTYHPAAVLRDFRLKPILFADLTKAARERSFAELRAPQREIWTEPTLADLDEFEARYIAPARYVSVDIETSAGQITCIGLAPSRNVAIVVPFDDMSLESRCYWPTDAEEVAAWAWVRRVLALPKQFVFQNGMYDMQWLWRVQGIPVPGAADDTMLLHHALQPEMQKSLGFLASIYTSEPSWKFMGKSNKREDSE